MDYSEQNSSLKKEKHMVALKWILVIGIVVVLNLFFNFSLKLIYDAPKYEDYCKMEQINIAPKTQQACVDQGGRWSENNYPIEKGSEVMGYCDVDFTCRQEFSDMNSVYNRNVFMVLVALGIASVVAGMFITVSSVSLGLSLGGVLSFVIASMRYWSDMDEYLRVIVLAIALFALIWVGVKKLKD
jgi:hypothetical protein